MMVSFLLTGLSQSQCLAFITTTAVMASRLFDVEETGGCWDRDHFRATGLCPLILAGNGLKTNLAGSLSALVAEIPCKADSNFIFAARGEPPGYKLMFSCAQHSVLGLFRQGDF